MPIDQFKVGYNQRRHHNNIGVDTHLAVASAPQVADKYVVDLHPGSCVYGDRGAKHFDPQHSHAQEWRCSMKQSPLSRAYGEEAVERGKKCIRPDPPPNGSEWPHSKRHDIPLDDGRQSGMRRGIEDPGLCVGMKSAKHFPPRGEAPQYDMESYMNKKQRVPSLDAMRNGIPCAVPGDRPFKVAEHEPGYYAKGGLIPGSSIQLRKKHSNLERKGSGTAAEGQGSGSGSGTTARVRPTFQEKQRMAREAYDRAQVLSLSVAGLKQGQEIPSFEARTGAYLVKPEDEAY
jgi:hypothetical protein